MKLEVGLVYRKSSLQGRIKKIREGSEVQILPKLGRFERTFSVEYEEELANNIRNLDDGLMRVNRQEFFKLAFILTEEIENTAQVQQRKFSG